MIGCSILITVIRQIHAYCLFLTLIGFSQAFSFYFKKLYCFIITTSRSSLHGVVTVLGLGYMWAMRR